MSRQIVITLPEWTEIKGIDNKQFADLLPCYDEMLNMIKNGKPLDKFLDDIKAESDQEVSSGREKNSKKLEKDFCKLDCISRADVNQVIEDYMDEQYHVFSDRTRERAFGAKAAMARINELPSVTLQEPKTDVLGEIRAEIEHLPTNYIEVQRPHSIVERDVVELGLVMQIIDKHRESEDKE